MHNTWIVFKKELLDTLRDRRTLLTAVVVPMLLLPLIMWGAAAFSASQTEEAQTKTLDVGLISDGNARAFADTLRARPDLNVVEGFPADSVRAFVRRDSLDAAFVFGSNFDQQVAGRAPGTLSLIYETGSDAGIERSRLTSLVDAYRQQLLDQRLASMNLDRRAIETVDLQQVDVATQRESIGQLVGGFLPYFFLIFCFMGGMYPAIDLGAGEKERHTMETLLTAPASRFQIAMGKFGVIATAGLLSALIAILGLYGGLLFIGDLPAGIGEVLESVMTPGAVLLLISLLLPLTMFFAGVQLVLSLYAKSFKEAQSIFGPLTIGVILPAALGLLPGMELTAVTALIPILNVALATKAIVAGTIDVGLLLLTYASLIVIAGLALAACAYYFQKESVIFRT